MTTNGFVAKDKQLCVINSIVWVTIWTICFVEIFFHIVGFFRSSQLGVLGLRALLKIHISSQNTSLLPKKCSLTYQSYTASVFFVFALSCLKQCILVVSLIMPMNNKHYVSIEKQTRRNTLEWHWLVSEVWILQGLIVKA